MCFAVEIVQYPETSFVAGEIDLKKYLDWYPFKVKNAVAEERDGYLWIYDGKKPKPWERPDKDYRATSQYKEWRVSVFSRDKHTCQDCGQIGGKLEGHHIKTFNKFPELRFDISNGVTLCRKCHMLRHGRNTNG